jgi:hypothetical protein
MDRKVAGFTLVGAVIGLLVAVQLQDADQFWLLTLVLPIAAFISVLKSFYGKP